MPRWRGGTCPVELDQRGQRHQRLIVNKSAQFGQLPVGDRRPLMVLPVVPGQMRGQQGGLPGFKIEAMGEIRSLVFKPQAQPEEHHEGGDKRAVPDAETHQNPAQNSRAFATRWKAARPR